MNVAEAVIYLASCAVNETKLEQTKISGIDFKELFSFASYHVMGAVVAMALENAGVKNAFVKNAISFSIRKNTFFEVTNSLVLRSLEDAGIWYMPLKGSVLKNYYPRFGMREMSDYDILFDASRADDVRNIMEALGFVTKYFGTGAHDVYYKEPLCNFEMHSGLFGISHDEKLYEYYADVKSRLIRDDSNNYGYHFTPEDFYLYMTAHEFKHYSNKGTGLRSILDVYVFLNKFGKLLDFSYIQKELAKLDLSDFERKNYSLALNLFDNQEISDENRKMLECIIHSGAYGNLETSIESKVRKNGGGTLGKLKYVQNRLSPTLRDVKKRNLALYKLCRILYPLLIIIRIIKAITISKQKVIQEIKILWKQ